MSQNVFIAAIKELGLDKNCGQIYQYLLSEPKLTISDLAKKIGSSRAKIYELVGEMEKFELLKYDKNKTRHLEIISPNTLLAKIKGKQIQTSKIVSDLSDNMPLYLAKFYEEKHNLSTKIYNGEDKFLELFDKLFEEAIGEILFISNIVLFHQTATIDFIKYVAKRRAKKGLPIRIISTPADSQVHTLYNSIGELRQTKMLPDSLFQGSILATNTSLSLWNPLLPQTVLITDPIITKTFEFMFNSIWNNLPNS